MTEFAWVSSICTYCDEPIVPGEEIYQYANGPVDHRNCFLRNIYGSVAHIRRKCGCFVPGSQAGDPEGLTRRQAADMAVAEYERKRPDAEPQGSQN